MYKLFYYPRNASWAPHMLLAELGVDYELELVDRKSEQQKSAGYMKLNPTGRIPTLAHNETVIFESAAICLYLCEQHPESNLLPAVGSSARAEFFQWLFYLTGSIQAELMPYFYPARHTTDPSMAESISAAQEQRVTEMFALIDRQLSQRDFLVGDQLTICDFFLFMLAHWASNFKTPPLSFESLGSYLRNLARRPSIQSVCRVEQTSLMAYQK